MKSSWKRHISSNARHHTSSGHKTEVTHVTLLLILCQFYLEFTCNNDDVMPRHNTKNISLKASVDDANCDGIPRHKNNGDRKVSTNYVKNPLMTFMVKCLDSLHTSLKHENDPTAFAVCGSSKRHKMSAEHEMAVARTAAATWPCVSGGSSLVVSHSLPSTPLWLQSCTCHKQTQCNPTCTC